MPPYLILSRKQGVGTAYINGIAVRDAGQPSGVYSINPDGGEPFDVYVNNDDFGGGWMMFANHTDSLTKIAQTPTPSTKGVLNDSQWQRLKSQVSDGGMFKDESNRISYITLANWNSAPYVNFNNVTSLLSTNYILHHETSGSDLTGADYTLVSLSDGVNGAALFQWGPVLFNTWPYTGQGNASYLVQNELQYYIR